MRSLSGPLATRVLSLSPGVERIVERRLEPELELVVPAVQQSKARSDRLEPPALGRTIGVGHDVGAVDHLAEQRQGGIPVESIGLQDALEGAAPIHVAERRALDVERRRAFPSRRVLDPLWSDEQELGLRVDEAANQPRA